MLNTLPAYGLGRKFIILTKKAMVENFIKAVSIFLSKSINDLGLNFSCDISNSSVPNNVLDHMSSIIHSTITLYSSIIDYSQDNVPSKFKIVLN